MMMFPMWNQTAESLFLCRNLWRESGMAGRLICAVAVCVGFWSQAEAAEEPKPGFLARASCTVVRYYVAKYTAASAEAWARSKGATEAEIETARHCLKVETAQGKL
jgi:hypothetical protein